MRLVCPNCSAQYEIDGSMIPDEGRDVQCSNCGHTWFELPPPSADFGEMSSDDFEDMDISEPETGTEIEEDEDHVTETADKEEAEAVPEQDNVEADDDQDEDESAGRASETIAAAAAAALADEDDEDFEDFDTALKPRRPADAASLDILREEAERELSQRRAPPSELIQTQTDLGIDEIRNRQSPSRALRARMAHLGEEQPETRTLDETEVEVETAEPEYPDTSDDDADYTEPRRDLLPDIDEINSTLKPARRRGAQTRAKKGNGFLIGFVLMMLLTAALIFAYAQAPAIARALPSTESKLISYVDRANGVRDWVQGLIGG